MNPRATIAAAKLSLLLAGVVCSSARPAAAQERAFDVTACQLTQHPDKYNEGLVSVEGLITIGPEEFMLHDRHCGDGSGRIWLEFGGGIPSPGMANAHGKSGPAEGLPLTTNRDFDALQKLVQAAQGKTKMLHATLIGKYFAGKPTTIAGGETVRAGYGRLGCCSLLVIEEVVSVGPELEEPVDFSPVAKMSARALAKGCTIAELQLSPREDEDQLERNSLKDEYQYLHDPKKVAARAVAVQEQRSPEDSAEDIARRLQTDWTTQSLASYHIVVNKPYWLLETAISGDAVIWVPKQMLKTECKPEIQRPKVPSH